MDQNTHVTLNTVLVLLVGIVQFFQRHGPDQVRLEDVVRRLEVAEQQLVVIQHQLSTDHSGTSMGSNQSAALHDDFHR
ncbi:MAG: hypothetical protein ABI947_12855 [Chloroflexota bacterium]